MNMLSINPTNLVGKGVEMSPKIVMEPTLPGIALTAAGLMCLGKILGDYLKSKIGEKNTIGLTLFGLLAGVSTAAIATLYQSPEGILAAGAISMFSAGMTMSTDNTAKKTK